MYYGLNGFWDYTYILVIIGAAICLLASAHVRKHSCNCGSRA